MVLIQNAANIQGYIMCHKAEDILVNRQSQPKCKKTDSNSSINFALKIFRPSFSAFLRSAYVCAGADKEGDKQLFNYRVEDGK